MWLNGRGVLLQISVVETGIVTWITMGAQMLRSNKAEKLQLEAALRDSCWRFIFMNYSADQIASMTTLTPTTGQKSDLLRDAAVKILEKIENHPHPVLSGRLTAYMEHESCRVSFLRDMLLCRIKQQLLDSGTTVMLAQFQQIVPGSNVIPLFSHS